MKSMLALITLFAASMLHAQTLDGFNGDHVLKMSFSACNQNARVEIKEKSISIINQDPRDNRGWSTTHLIPGEKRSVPAPGYERINRVSFKKTTIEAETLTIRNMREVAYEKDVYSFSDTQGRKSLKISLATETRGNVSSYGVTCLYEKR